MSSFGCTKQWKEDMILVMGKSGRGHLGYKGMNRRMILNCSLRKYSGRFLEEARNFFTQGTTKFSRNTLHHVSNVRSTRNKWVYIHPARQIMKNAARRTVHQIPALISSDENCSCMHKAVLKHVKTNTAPDTAPPRSQLPTNGLSHLKLGFSLPAIANSTICKPRS